MSSPLSLEDDSAVERFRRFLRMRTVANEGTTNGANAEAVAFLRDIGESAGMKATVLEYAPNLPVLVLTCPGRDPALPSILLNSHYDVVPVMQEHWKVDAFAAHMDDNGDIYGRGTQDMKSVCMQYLEAMLRLLRDGTAPFLRTVHLSFMPDEETGGEQGMQPWVESAEFQALNVGFALDEGIANPGAAYTVFHGERGVWWLTLNSEGPTGHASRFIENPATHRLLRAVDKFLSYRDQQERKLLQAHANHPSECSHAVSHKLQLGDVITLNLTVLKAGVSVDGGRTHSYNVIPQEASAGFDIRLPPSVPLEEFEARVQEWTKEEGLSYSVRKFSAEHVTSLDAQRNPFWAAFKRTLEADGSAKVEPQIFPAGTDSRFLRRASVPAVGFSPLSNTPVLLHDHNEFVNRSVFLRGISIYERLVPALANLHTMEPTSGAVYAAEKQPLDPDQPRAQQ